MSQDDGRAWCRGRGCDATLGQTEHGGGGEARRERGCRRQRRLEGVAATAEQGGAVLGLVLVCEGESRRTARVGGSSRQVGRAVGEGKRRLAMQAGRSGHRTESTGLGGALAARVEGEGEWSLGVCGTKVWLCAGGGARREGSKSAFCALWPFSARSLIP